MSLIDDIQGTIATVRELVLELNAENLLAVERARDAESQEDEMRKAYNQREGYIAELEDLLAREREKTRVLKEAMKASLGAMLREED